MDHVAAHELKLFIPMQQRHRKRVQRSNEVRRARNLDEREQMKRLNAALKGQ